MIKETRRVDAITFAGGLDMETPGLSVEPGRMLSCKNYEIDALGGYSRIEGYERLDGHPSPAEATEESTEDARRGEINAVPGSGPVRGVAVFKGNSYAFRDSEDGSAAFMYQATPTGWQVVTTPALLPGGKYDLKTYNFKATGTSEVLIGSDGVNPAFIFDGTTFTQITIPGESRAPSYCCPHNMTLFLGFSDGTIYYSVVGTPTSFDPLLDAGEMGAGDFLTGLVPAIGGALCIQMKNKIAMLYGATPADWEKRDLRNHDDKIGATPFSTLTFNDLYYLDDRGLTTLSSSQNFGNFQSATFSRGINPALRNLRGRFVCAHISRRKNQMRWYFAPKTALAGSEILTATFVNGQMAGFTRQVMSFRAACCASGELSDGEEIILVGSDTGMVYRMDKGNSFDGDYIEAYFRTAFGHSGNPRIKKSYKNAIFNVQAGSETSISVKPLFDYSDPLIAAHRLDELSISGGGASWDEGNWGEFRWSSQVLSEGRADFQGIARNIAVLVYSKSKTAKPHTFFDVQLTYSPRGLTQ